MIKSCNFGDNIKLAQIDEIVERGLNKLEVKYNTLKHSAKNSDKLSEIEKKEEIKKLNLKLKSTTDDAKKDISKEIKILVSKQRELMSNQTFLITSIKNWAKLSPEQKNLDLAVKYNEFITPDGKKLYKTSINDKIMFDFTTTYRDVFMTDFARIKKANSHLNSASIKVEYSKIDYLSLMLENSITKCLTDYKKFINIKGATGITENEFNNKKALYDEVLDAFKLIYPIQQAKIQGLKNVNGSMFHNSSDPLKTQDAIGNYQASEKYLNNLKQSVTPTALKIVEQIIQDSIRIGNKECELHKHYIEPNLNILLTNSKGEQTFLTNYTSKTMANEAKSEVIAASSIKKTKKVSTKNINAIENRN